MKTNLDLADTFRTTNTYDESNKKRGQIHHKQDSENAMLYSQEQKSTYGYLINPM